MRYLNAAACHRGYARAGTLVACLALILAAAPTGATSILYEQAPESSASAVPSHEPDPDFGGSYYADAFMFGPGPGVVLTQIEWWGRYEGPEANISGEFAIRIFDQAGIGGPGALLAEYTSVTPGQTSAGDPWIQFSWALPTGLALASDVPYYLAIAGMEDPIFDGVSFYWDLGDGPALGEYTWTYSEVPFVGSGWISNDPALFGGGPQHLAFRLLGHENIIPEPATLTLLGLGLGGLAVRRLRTRKG